MLCSTSSCIKLPRHASIRRNASASLVAHTETPNSQRININTATPEELKTLPGIGEAFASRIIEHREKYGRFRRVEHLLMVRGISERRFAQLQTLITVE